MQYCPCGVQNTFVDNSFAGVGLEESS